MPQGTGTGKTAPTTTNIGSTNINATEFRENAHRGHRLTFVGSFRQDTATADTEVWYCNSDHVLVVS